MISGITESGVRYAVKKSNSSAAYCALSIKCGTRDEEGFHSGIAHFTEHTMFKGTSRRSAKVINGYLDKLGGELNAYTTKEEIVLHATVLKEDLRKAAELLLEMATEPVFPEKEIETEKGVVIDEIQSYKDSPSDDVYDKFEEALFAGHPLGRPILGTPASVKKITSEELKRFVTLNFTPDRMAFTVVADIEERKLEKMVLKMLSKAFPNPVEHTESAECQGFAKGDIFDRTVDKKLHEANAVMGGLAPSLYESKERITAVLLGNVLGGPASNSILNNELREKNGWVYGVECSYTQYKDTGIFVISLGCDKENLQKCFNAISKAVNNLKTKTLSESRLKAAKKQLIGQLAISGESCESQCLSMGKSLLAFSRIASDKENKAAIESVTAEDLRQMALRIFDEGNCSRLIYL